MASVMAIGSEAFGSSTGEIEVLAGVRDGDLWLCSGEILEAYSGRKSGSILATEVG